MAHTSFCPVSDADCAAMLEAVGARTLEDLFADIPEHLKTQEFRVPKGISELEMMRRLRGLAARNSRDLINFCGGGFYDHYIPAAVNALASRGEFYTAYTPYQAEASQGTLQAIYEWQSAIALLTEMDVANASLYDGGTALFEGMLMALRATERSRALVCQGVNPIYRVMLRSYTANLALDYREIPLKEGRTDRSAFAAALDDEVGVAVLQYPNFFGVIEDYSDLIAQAHRVGALAVVSAYPVALGALKTPGAMGADIVTGEGQSLGIPLSFGGPYLGFMTARQDLVRRMPGRIVGATTDRQGRRGFVLTLQAREQHIRREKATSNICTNEALCALRALIFMTLLGRQGMAELAERCGAAAAYAHRRLTAIPGVTPAFSAPFFNEFALTLPRDAADVVGTLIDHGIAAGFPVSRYYADMERVLLLAFTEKRTKEEIDLLATRLEAALTSS